MKRFFISAVLTVMALGLAVFSYFDLRSSGTRIYTSLDRGISCIDVDDPDSAAKEINGAIKLWRKCEGRFELYVYSEEMFEIDENFSKIEKLLNDSDTQELKKLCYENSVKIKRLVENQTPSVKKVF